MKFKEKKLEMIWSSIIYSEFGSIYVNYNYL